MNNHVGFGTIVAQSGINWNISTDDDTIWVSGWSFAPEDRSKIKVGDNVSVTYAIGRYFVKIVEE